MTNIEELSKRRLAELDELFEDYQTIDHDIRVREYELDHPIPEQDDNIGGGRSTIIARPQERIAINRDDDRRLQYLYKLKQDCATVVAMMDESQYSLYQLRYQHSGYYSWAEVADQLHIGRSAVYRKRFALLSLLAKQRGLI